MSASPPLIQQGKLKALAKLNHRPLAAFPELQHLAVAADLPGVGDISTWSGLVAPGGTPHSVVEKINAAVAKAAAQPDIRARLDRFGISPGRHLAGRIRTLHSRRARSLSGIKLD